MAAKLVLDLMSKEVLCAAADAPVTEVVASMRGMAYSCVIISEDEAPVGIITERDIVGVLDQMLNHDERGDLTAASFMSQPVITIREDAPVFEAVVVCHSRNVRHLPVVDRYGRLAGLLTQSDLTRAHMSSIEEQRSILEEAAAGAGDLLSANEHLKALAYEDALLQVGNRRAMEVDLQYTHEASLRYGTVYSIAVCDVDHFKQYNDTLGHQAGDAVLRRLVDHIKASVRKSDRIYRYGGDELLLLLPMTQVLEAQTLCRRLLGSLAELAIPHPSTQLGALTISCGISGVNAGSRRLLNWRQVFEEADNALYRVKRSGRNAVAAFRSSPSNLRAPQTQSASYRVAKASRR